MAEETTEVSCHIKQAQIMWVPPFPMQSEKYNLVNIKCN